MNVRTVGAARLLPAPAGMFLRDVSSWSDWADEAYAARPSMRGRARSAQHRIALARRHGLRRLDQHRATSLELAGLLHEVGGVVGAGDAHRGDSHHTAGARFLASVGLHDVAALVAGLLPPSVGERAVVERDAGIQHSLHQVDRELLAMLRYIEMTTDDDGCAIAMHEKRSMLVAHHGQHSVEVASFDSGMHEALAGQRLLTFGRARHAS